ncbi:MAG: hypothetical protein WC867_00430 [Candidatus Pacearchaeota archaeon]|jgi:hypothetical protein
MKSKEYFIESINHIKTSERMTYYIYPIIDDKRFILKILDSINKSLFSLFQSILINDNLDKKLKNSKQDKDFLKNYSIKIRKKYNLSNKDIKTIHKLINLSIIRKKSAIDIVKDKKIILMMEDLNTFVLEISSIKEYITFMKNLQKKVEFIIK